MSKNNQSRLNDELSEASNIDELLDRSLEHYRAIEPRSGLEQRLLAHLKSAPAPVPAWTWRVALPTAVTVFVAIGALYVAFRPTAQLSSPAETTTAQISPEEPTIPENVKPPRKPSNPVRTAREPERVAARSVSPSPASAPESQEDLLLEFLRASGAMARLSEVQEARTAPPKAATEISIPSLSIEFLPGFNPEDFEQGE